MIAIAIAIVVVTEMNGAAQVVGMLPVIVKKPLKTHLSYSLVTEAGYDE